MELGARVLLTQHAQRPSKAINKCGDAGREMKRTSILLRLSVEVCLNAANLIDHRSRVLCQTMSHGSRQQLAAGAYEKFGLEVLCEILKLQTHGGGRQVDALGTARDATGLQDRQKYLKLVYIHAPTGS